MRYGLAVAVIGAAAITACSAASHSAAPPDKVRGALPPASAGPVTAAGCLARRSNGPLPVWARGGFHPPGMPMGHVMGVRGEIVAILFGGSLYANSQNNKILWVARLPLPVMSPSPMEASRAASSLAGNWPMGRARRPLIFRLRGAGH